MAGPISRNRARMALSSASGTGDVAVDGAAAPRSSAVPAAKGTCDAALGPGCAGRDVTGARAASPAAPAETLARGDAAGSEAAGGVASVADAADAAVAAADAAAAAADAAKTAAASGATGVDYAPDVAARGPGRVAAGAAGAAGGADAAVTRQSE